MDITGIWEGTLDGTNWGRLLAKLTERDGAIGGFAEIVDIGLGTYNLGVKGSRRGDVATLHLSPGPYNVRVYPGTIDVQVLSETATLIRGEWRSTIGTYGTFRAERQLSPEPPPEEIAKRIAESNAAFIIMSFSDQSAGFIPIVDIHRAKYQDISFSMKIQSDFARIALLLHYCLLGIPMSFGPTDTK